MKQKDKNGGSGGKGGTKLTTPDGREITLSPTMTARLAPPLMRANLAIDIDFMEIISSSRRAFTVLPPEVQKSVGEHLIAAGQDIFKVVSGGPESFAAIMAAFKATNTIGGVAGPSQAKKVKKHRPSHLRPVGRDEGGDGGAL